MATVHTGMAMSLDGFVADRNGNTRQLSDPDAHSGSEYMNALIQETGAVVMGRRTFEMAEDPDWYVGNEPVLEHRNPRAAPEAGEF